jgi:deazaflavin-dependent oxidoreductase (nitroreductase family)
VVPERDVRPADAHARLALFQRQFPYFVPLKRIIPAVHLAVFRLSGGRYGTLLAGHKMLLLTTKGRRSGKRWAVPLLYMEHDGRFLVIGSNWGGPRSPLWVANIAAEPHVRLRVGRRKLRATAHVASGEERDQLWSFVKENYDRYATYERRLGASREIPLVVLTPDGAA